VKPAPPPPKVTPPVAPPVASVVPPLSSTAPPVASVAPPVSSTAPPASSGTPPVSSAAPPPAPKTPAAPVEAPPPRLVIDIAPPAEGPAWFGLGLEDVIGDEFRRFHSVELAKKIDPVLCPGRRARCLVDQYRAAGVQVVVLGALEKQSKLAYEVYETWTGTRAFVGALPVAGISMTELQRQAGDIVRPILQRGGLLDQRPAAVAPDDLVPKLPPRAQTALTGYWLPLLVAALIVLVASPVLLAVFLVGTRELGRRETPASWKWSAMLVVVLASIPITAGLLDVPALFARFAARAPPILGLLPAIGAGALWGALALAVGVWLLAPIRGLERIRHDALWPLLRSWIALTFLRGAALVVLHAPLFVLTLRVCAEIELPTRATFAFAVPVAGLVTHFLLLSVVDNLSVYLDKKLVVWPPTARNPWHATIKRYFTGYVRRNVVDIDAKIMDRTLFLPSTRPDVVVYGGGFARPRIVVGEKPIEAALGELPDEEQLPDRTVNPEELPLGIVIPSMKASDDQAQLTKAETWRHKVATAPTRARAHMPRLLGENTTLLGWVLPQSAEKGIPLISDTEEDFGVVKRLLTEHYGAYEGSLHDDEVDDTDPTQKDFLFGALLREMGTIARHDVLFTTVYWALAVAWPGPSIVARFFRLPITLYEALLSAPAAKVGDAYAALNSGLHHLIQYLCYLRGIDDAKLTARANFPRLANTSREMLATLAGKEPTAEERRDVFRATPRDRAEWLTSIFHGQPVGGRIRWGRLLGSIAFVVIAGVLLVRSVSAAIAYHPVYVERMKSQASKSSLPSTAGENVR
jgi:hypothetical protein